MIKLRLILLFTIIILTSGCTEFALLMSGSSFAISQNAYARAYNVIDVGVVITTKKGIKQHAYNSAKKVLTGVKEGKKYIYDNTINLFGNKH